MNNTTLRLKLIERCNKLASNDFDNIGCWQVVEAFNKAQIEWVRRQLRGSNVFQDGDEASKRRITDLQKILIDSDVDLVKKDLFYESTVSLPANYLEFKRIDIKACSEDCSEGRKMMVYLAEEDNRNILLRDKNTNPNFEWGETFCTFINNKVRIYTNNEFELEDCKLTYYRFPVYIQIEGCVDPYTTTTSPTDVICEFKDDIVELIIDEAAGILTGDIENQFQASRNRESAERNN